MLSSCSRGRHRLPHRAAAGSASARAPGAARPCFVEQRQVSTSQRRRRRDSMVVALLLLQPLIVALLHRESGQEPNNQAEHAASPAKIRRPHTASGRFLSPTESQPSQLHQRSIHGCSRASRCGNHGSRGSHSRRPPKHHPHIDGTPPVTVSTN